MATLDTELIEKRRQEKKALREQKKLLKRQQMQEQYPEKQEQQKQPVCKPGNALGSPSPYRRAWRSNFRHRPITIMSYNILAQALCQRTLHPQAEQMLKWKTRRRMIIEEIAYYQPDLMCLQEVDNYEEFYKEAFAGLGYVTIFEKHETKRHGCMIGYRQDVWKRLAYKRIDYDSDSSCKPTQTTGNIGQLVALAFVEGSSFESNGDLPSQAENDVSGVILSNTHMYWRPPSTYERCRQGLIYMHHLLKFKNEMCQRNVNHHWVPLMLGDFNTQPSDPFYSIVTGQPLTEEHIQILKDTKRAFGDDDGEASIESKDNSKLVPPEDEVPPTTTVTPVNELMDIEELLDLIGPSKDDAMQSVYSHHKRLWTQHEKTLGNDITEDDHNRYEVGEPNSTNHTHVFKGTLDYLFIPQQAIVLDILLLPPKDKMHPAIPNQHFGSDHVCLLAKVLLP